MGSVPDMSGTDTALAIKAADEAFNHWRVKTSKVWK